MIWQLNQDYPPNDVITIWGWTVVQLKQSLNNEGVYIRSNARKQDLVRQMCIVLGRKPNSQYGSPMSVHDPMSR